MSTIDISPVEADIAAFAASVRRRLDDLPADEVDELVDGLPADMADQAADSGVAFALPDAAAYADELRAAAGLPPRVEPGRGPGLVERVARRSKSLTGRLRAHPAAAATWDFLAALRPAWWLIRAVVVFEAITVFGRSQWLQLDLVGVVILVACVIVSVQWGRGRWLPRQWGRGILVTVNLAAWVLLPMLVFGAMFTYAQWRSYSSSTPVDYSSSTPGLAVDGERVRNVFAYDAEGNPIERVQLFDQNGRPLTTVGQGGQSDDFDWYFYGGGGPTPVGEREIGRQPVWNIFPLQEIAAEDWLSGDPAIDDAVAPTFPFPQVPSVTTGDPAPNASPAPQATSYADPTAAPAP
ncbi:hypothetical protein DEU34_2645 [Microbacterium sp. AG1240]|uniref:hypothetical protein n=1 Tax=Microbacterium sp. AG1240 TaxID=2183992 RepID=UPI000EABA090|nr:hypothetical protein [Microbacterium sp. AG1240]RKT31574.1 hypothetical protein DEU34_2645 [Microbacterium sp. AG1240]